VSERDRLAALQTGHSGAPVGLTTYLRDQVDKLRGTDDIHTRRERMRKLDIKIKEVGFPPSYVREQEADDKVARSSDDGS
jgi:hypothetical protein